MKEILKITASLTAVCIAAALILGAVFAKTEHVRKENEEKMQEETIRSLLGYGAGKQVPADLKVYPVYRYVLQDSKGATLLGYVLPMKDKGFALMEVDLTGKPGKVIPVKADAAQLAEAATRDVAVQAALPPGTKVVYAQTLFVANLGNERLGYVIPGVTQGFKTFIKLMVALNKEFTVKDIAILESEEDPGLGDEIKKDFFKNQFKGKTEDVLKGLDVVKQPIPPEYLPVLEPAVAKKQGLKPDQVREIETAHLKDNIYAITGATISSRAVTNGVKDTVRKFVYRLALLDKAIKQEKIEVAF
jgi:Na+-translocating ferredoxin:NAD+ oxidoreductase subunit G